MPCYKYEQSLAFLAQSVNMPIVPYTSVFESMHMETYLQTQRFHRGQEAHVQVLLGSPRRITCLWCFAWALDAQATEFV